MKPKAIKRGSFLARIYAVPTRRKTKDGEKTYNRFEVRWTDFGGRKHRVKRSSLAAAKKLADDKAEDLSQGKLESNRNPLDLQSYDQGVLNLAPTGIRFADAGRMVADWFAAVRVKMGRKPTQLEFEDFTARAISRMAGFNHLGRKTALEALPEFLGEKRRRKLISARHQEDLQERLTVFAKRFDGQLCDLTVEPIEQWLHTLSRPGPEGKPIPVSNRTQNNYLGALKNFSSWCAGAGLVDDQVNQGIQKIEAAETEDRPTEIFTPAEMELLLGAAPREFEIPLAIGAFAGLRSSEICRLDWREVKPERGVIEVTAGKSKTAMRRLAPITSNLSSFIGPNPPGAGKVWRHSRAYFHELQLATASGSLVKWKHNALRHSFISYRLAAINDVNQVALEAGNSAKMIHAHYRELVTAADAGKWFALKSISGGRKIVQGVFAALAGSN